MQRVQYWIVACAASSKNARSAAPGPMIAFRMSSGKSPRTYALRVVRREYLRMLVGFGGVGRGGAVVFVLRLGSIKSRMLRSDDRVAGTAFA
jgi:hypothetical protein